MTTWLITGCSTGLGRALAKAVLARGDNAVVTARDANAVKDITDPYPDTGLRLPLDVSDLDQIADVHVHAEERFGGIDVLINNAGHGHRSAVEEADDTEIARLFATNFFGPVALINTVLPSMRARRGGVIVNISSIAGRRSNPGSGYYAATKCALEAVSDALRKEVAPLGIRVMVIEPGAFRTDFSGRSLTESSHRIDDYADTLGSRRKENDSTHGHEPGDPARAAEAIINLVEGSENPFRLLLGSDAVAIITAELENQISEVNAWATVSVTTDLPGVTWNDLSYAQISRTAR